MEVLMIALAIGCLGLGIQIGRKQQKAEEEAECSSVAEFLDKLKEDKK